MSSLPQILHTISYMALPLMLAMVLHEYGHGWVANRYGDPTARLEGRLTLNPLAHVDPFGTIILPLLCLLIPGGFFLGWAKPVPINPARLHNPRSAFCCLLILLWLPLGRHSQVNFHAVTSLGYYYFPWQRCRSTLSSLMCC